MDIDDSNRKRDNGFTFTMTIFTHSTILFTFFTGIVAATFKHKHCIAIVGIHTSFFESSTNVCRGYSIEPSLSKYKVEIELRNNYTGVLLVERMAFLLPVSLQGSKQTNIKGLTLVRGMRWKAKDNNSVFFRKLNRLGLKM